VEPRYLLDRLATSAEHDGWRAAVIALLSGYPDLLRYVGDERAGDWRFLLPELPAGDVLCVGGSLSPVPLSLARTCRSVTVQCGAVHGRFLLARAREEGFSNVSVVSSTGVAREYGTIAVLRSPMRAGAWRGWAGFPQRSGRDLQGLLKMIRPGGWLYAEVDSPAVSAPPGVMRRRLRRSGYSAVEFYWPKPTFRHCEMLMPMGDRDVQSYYLDYQFFATSPARRILRFVLRMAVKLGLFDLTVPAYSVLARRGSGDRP
jgi:hypothetical protein